MLNRYSMLPGQKSLYWRNTCFFPPGARILLPPLGQPTVTQASLGLSRLVSREEERPWRETRGIGEVQTRLLQDVRVSVRMIGLHFAISNPHHGSHFHFSYKSQVVLAVVGGAVTSVQFNLF